jgi:hypothetical protein
MEGRGKPHTDKYKVITNDGNYDASCMLTSLPVWDLENFRHLVFVVQSVHVVGTIPEAISNFCIFYPIIIFVFMSGTK